MYSDCPSANDGFKLLHFSSSLKSSVRLYASQVRRINNVGVKRSCMVGVSGSEGAPDGARLDLSVSVTETHSDSHHNASRYNNIYHMYYYNQMIYMASDQADIIYTSHVQHIEGGYDWMTAYEE